MERYRSKLKYLGLIMKGQKKTENVLYLVLWAILFAAPVLSMYVGAITSHSSTYDWQGVLNAWELLAMFAVTFAIHNFLIAPLVVYRNNKWTYAGLTLVLAIVFFLYQTYNRPHPPEPIPHEHREPMRFGHGPEIPPRKPMREHKEPEPPRAFGGQDSVAFIIMALLLGLNVGVKYFFKSLDDRKRMRELERENLNRQLEYLKYQINPHFFMNTLNNIHALVDIDPEQAKYTIEVLSKLMRYVLYEGNKSMAPLQKELSFITHYVDLMRIRYTDKVRISVSLPSAAPDVMVPSLLFTTFVENAFKHGVSYEQESFIEVSVDVEDNYVEFLCCNSRKNSDEDTAHGGVGLQNAIKRLQLIYGDDYTLSITTSEKEYRLILRLPMEMTLKV